MRYLLEALSGDDRGRRWPLQTGRNTIGRAVGTDVRLEDGMASRVHCALDVGEEIWIEDLGSLNATYVNGDPVERRRLYVDDHIAVGATEMVLAQTETDDDDALQKTIAQSAPQPWKLRDFEVQLLGHGIVGQSSAIMDVLDKVARLSRTSATVLITGPSGSGKELIAYALHICSPRKDHRFVSVPCMTLSDVLLESELFGHEACAFAGAGAARDGLFHYARGGTIFLDEICDMPLGCQAKLLRVIEDRTFCRLGSNRPEPADCRIIAATARDIQQSVRARLFRQDLSYRITAVQIDLPPLAERSEDIELLAAQFTEKVSCQHSLPPKSLSPGAIERLRGYHWPGNVRELQAVIERAVLLGQSSTITPSEIELPARGRR
ncbi:MAG: sigma 54-interacting transcriptional regulator [Acidobacteriota bacterium]